MTKFIQIPPNDPLGLKITDHSNNQNGITARDLQSNNLIQTRLQNEIERKYSGEFHYRIKRGEHPEWDEAKVLENEEVGRMLLVFDLDKPETWSQKYKIFGELYSDIFGRKEVTAGRIIFLHDLLLNVRGSLVGIENEQIAEYTLTTWLIYYLVKEALLLEPMVRPLYENPEVFMREKNGRKRLRACTLQVTTDITTMLNEQVKNKMNDTPDFDYKREFKNKTYISELRAIIMPFYKMACGSKYCKPFLTLWSESKLSAATSQP